MSQRHHLVNSKSMPAQFEDADMALNVTTCTLKPLASPHSEVPLGSFTKSFPGKTGIGKSLLQCCVAVT